ncbi:MAG: hypothetical protein LBE89_04070 [Helicobacteraceae bacterium]|jgi:hypothetical protein|nr:hypothetical protein [Helicobacteraceae bacterium]
MKDKTAKKRLLFVKELERFLRRALRCECGWAEFSKLVADGARKLDEIDAGELYSPRYTAMLNTANELSKRAKASEGDAVDLRLWLAREINALEKRRRQAAYRRVKNTDTYDD